MATYYSDMMHSRTCVYRCYDQDEVLLYVGMSMNLAGRLSKHHSSGWWPQVSEVTVKWYEGQYARDVAREAEKIAIREEAPIYNIARPVSVRIRVID